MGARTLRATRSELQAIAWKREIAELAEGDGRRRGLFELGLGGGNQLDPLGVDDLQIVDGDATHNAHSDTRQEKHDKGLAICTVQSIIIRVKNSTLQLFCNVQICKHEGRVNGC